MVETAMPDRLKPLIAAVAEGRALSRSEAETAFRFIMRGEATPAQIGAILMGLRVRGETVDEIAGAAAAMRGEMRRISAPADAIDIVGTGGDGRGTLNISTAAAIVTASAGQPVAKHGNRKLSSQSGAGDVLGVLGVDLDADFALLERALTEAGIAFMIAPRHHAAMRHVMPARQELGTRTVFNILGPLTNPAGVKRQLTGAFSREMLRPMAETLGALGTERAWLVHGSDGADELAISGPSYVVEWNNGAVTEFEVTPEEAGLSRHGEEAIKGGTPEENAEAMRRLLAGETATEQDRGYRQSTALNAGAALVIADKAADLKEGVRLALESIDTGKARATLDALVRITRGG